MRDSKRPGKYSGCDLCGKTSMIACMSFTALKLGPVFSNGVEATALPASWTCTAASADTFKLSLRKVRFVS
jgi:hypothetical protein